MYLPVLLNSHTIISIISIVALCANAINIMDVVHLFLNSVISMFITLGRLRLNSFFILKMYSMLIGVNSAASSVIRLTALVRPMVSTHPYTTCTYYHLSRHSLGTRLSGVPRGWWCGWRKPVLNLIAACCAATATACD